MNKDLLFLRAARCETVERPPVWIMRQAGRYMAEYNAVKARHSFLEICRTPELAVEVSLQPMTYLNVDASIIFSDILIPLAALGIEVEFNPGPVLLNPLRSAQDIGALRQLEVKHCTDFVPQAIRLLRSELNRRFPEGKAVLGFAGAPWTMACYLIEQKPFKHFERTQIFAHESPEKLHQLLTILTQITIEYLTSQIEAGADAVQLFDTWAGNLSLDEYRQFALPYTRKIFEALAPLKAPGVLYINGCSHLLPGMIESGAQVIGLDWRAPLASASAIIPSNLAIQGNLDPSALYGSCNEVRLRTLEMLKSMKDRPGYIANLGHGILQTTPRENALEFVKTVQGRS